MSDVAPYEVLVEDGIPVELPSGGTIYVLTNAEKTQLESIIKRYLEDNHFKNIADLLDIDKLVTFELFVHRWNLWMGKGKDYYDEEVNVKALADTTDRISTEIRQLKKQLGVDKLTRDRLTGDDSVAARWDKVLQRAKEFGYKRNEEASAAIEAMHRIAGALTYHRNLDEYERKQFHMEVEDLLEIIDAEVAAFKDIDNVFRNRPPDDEHPEGGQKYWIRSQ